MHDECRQKSTGDSAIFVNHPPHYTQGGIECIDALSAATEGLTGIEAVCTANAIKYLWRWKRKSGLQDLEKAKWYINHLEQHIKKKQDAVKDDGFECG